MKRVLIAAIGFVFLHCDGGLLKQVRKDDSREKFEMKQDASGRTIRLNKVTGEMAVLEGSTLIAVKTPEEAGSEAASRRSLSDPKSWPNISLTPIAEDLSASLQTSWRDGKLHYRFSLTASEKLQVLMHTGRAYRSFDILLLDAGGFNIVGVTVPFRDLIRIVNNDGTAAAFEANDSVACGEDTYRSALTWTVQWHV